MTARLPSAWLLSLTLLAAACGDEDDGGDLFDAALGADASTPDAATPDAGAPPITAPANSWTWIDFPEAACDDGTMTGIGVNLNPASSNLIVFFEGGGACWDYNTCAVLNTSVHGPFGATQFATRAAGLGGALSRSDAMNPFRDWNMVYVPYCTGDIHGGDNVVTYTQSGGSATRTMHHVGHANVLAYLARLAPTFPAPARLVVSGSSAGGFGAVLNYATLRDGLQPAKGYLIDDSGPLFIGNAIIMPLRDAFYASWNLAVVADPLCGQACRTDFSAGLTALSTRFPADRLTLLSSLQDQTIRAYFLMSGDAFQTALLALASDVLEETDNFEYFFVSGSSHTMLGNPGGFMSNGTTLWSWLATLVGDGALESTRP